jgi:hypothetical protein
MKRYTPLLSTPIVALFALSVIVRPVTGEEGSAAPAAVPVATATPNPGTESNPPAQGTTAAANEVAGQAEPMPSSDTGTPPLKVPSTELLAEPTPAVPSDGTTEEGQQNSPQDTGGESAAAPATEAVPEPTMSPPGPAAETKGESEEDESMQTGATLLVSPRPPSSLQTLVDERRDRLRDRRRAMREAFLGPYRHGPPWVAARQEALERYRDAMRAYHRRQRDYNRLQHDIWLGTLSPWSKAHRDWAAQRSYLRQMQQLDRQEQRDLYLYGVPSTFGGPSPGW